MVDTQKIVAAAVNTQKSVESAAFLASSAAVMCLNDARIGSSDEAQQQHQQQAKRAKPVSDSKHSKVFD